MCPGLAGQRHAPSPGQACQGGGWAASETAGKRDRETGGRGRGSSRRRREHHARTAARPQPTAARVDAAEEDGQKAGGATRREQQRRRRRVSALAPRRRADEKTRQGKGRAGQRQGRAWRRLAQLGWCGCAGAWLAGQKRARVMWI